MVRSDSWRRTRAPKSGRGFGARIAPRVCGASARRAKPGTDTPAGVVLYVTLVLDQTTGNCSSTFASLFIS